MTWWIDETPPVGPIEEPGKYHYDWTYHRELYGSTSRPLKIFVTTDFMKKYGHMLSEKAKEHFEIYETTWRGPDIKLYETDEIERPVKPKPKRAPDRGRPNTNTGPRPERQFGHNGRKKY